MDKYQEVRFRGPLDRIAIVFHPCGLNHFIKVVLGELLQPHFSLFTHFGERFNQQLEAVFNTDSLEQQREQLDQILGSRLTEFNEPVVLQAVDQLLSGQGSNKVTELAAQLSTSRRTLLRKFKAHLGYSVEEYLSVIRFRRALLNYQQSLAVDKYPNRKVRLGEIAVNSNYYDQPDFNRSVKNRSGLTPKALFEQLNIVDDVLFWKL